MFANTDWYLYNFRLPLAKALRKRGHEVVLISPNGEYASRFAEDDFRWIEFEFSRTGINPLRELMTLFRLIKLYRAEKADLAHHFTIKCVLYGGLAARACHLPATINAVTGLGHVFTTNSFRNRFVRPFVMMLYRLSLKRSQVIFQNGDDQLAFGSLGLVSKGNSHVVRGSGVNTVKFQPFPRRVDAKTVKVVMLARLLKEKGVREFVVAATQVRNQLPHVQFYLAGDPDLGNPSSITAAQISSWDIRGDVTLLGHVSNVLALFEMADIVVLPSYREGTPRSLLEAAACGLPLVASNVPGCREIVRHNENGILVPPYNAHDLAQAIVRLVSDPVLRAQMGKVSREIAVKEFSEERVIGETEKVYMLATIL